MRVRLFRILLCWCALAALSPAAMAANGDFFSCSAIHTRMGSHPSFDANIHAGIYASNNGVSAVDDWALLMSATHTFINASVPSGIHFNHNGFGGPANGKWTLASGGRLLGNTFGNNKANLDVEGQIQIREDVTWPKPGIVFSLNGDNQQFFGRNANGASDSQQELGIWNNAAWRYIFRGNDVALKFCTTSWAVALNSSSMQETRPFEQGLATLEKVRPVHFRYNKASGANQDRSYVGVVAEDLEKVAPFMVDGKAVNPGAFTYMLVNSVKELSAKNKRLKKLLCTKKPSLALCS